MIHDPLFIAFAAFVLSILGFMMRKQITNHEENRKTYIKMAVIHEEYPPHIHDDPHTGIKYPKGMRPNGFN